MHVDHKAPPQDLLHDGVEHLADVLIAGTILDLGRGGN